MKTAIPQPIPYLGSGFVIAETEYLEIVHFSQRHIHRKLIRKRRISVCRIRQKVEWMRVANQPMLRVGQVSNHSVGRKQARRGGIRICSVVRKQEVVGKIQESQVPPVAGVKFLSVKKLSRGRRMAVSAGAEVGNIRNSLFFVHD